MLNEYFQMPPFLRKHGLFGVLISLAFGTLYAEQCWFMHTIQGTSYYITICNTVLVLLVMLLGFITSFYLPPILVPETKLKTKAEEGMIQFLAKQWTVSIFCLVIANVIVLGLFANWFAGDLASFYPLIKLFFLYGLLGITFLHGIVLYIRYVEYLYKRKEDQPIKILTITVSIAVISLALFLFAFSLDMAGLHSTAGSPQQGILGLHVYFRDFYIASLMLWAYLWHIISLADH